MKRRAFISLLGGVAIAWPVAADAQQSLPVIGFLSSASPDSDAPRLIPFHRGLSETGFVKGHNVTIEYRGMQGHYDLLPSFIADFVHRQVAVIVAGATTPGALAAKAATSTIPIVFNIGNDPVAVGLVESLNRPGGNVTGISNLTGPLAAKRLEILRELLPGAATIAVLANPTNAPLTEYEMAELRKAAAPLGLQLHIVNATTIGEIDAAFATLPQARVDAVLVSSEYFLSSRSEQLVALAARYAIPTSYTSGAATRAGGLMSYGYMVDEVYHQMGIYAGRILKGEKPADLPVVQSTRIELLINLKTAKALGLNVPVALLARADEVIE